MIPEESLDRTVVTLDQARIGGTDKRPIVQRWGA